MTKLNHAEVYDLRQAGVRAKELAERFGVVPRSIYNAAYEERFRRLEQGRARLISISTDTTPVFYQLEDGWYGKFGGLHVGPCADPEGYTAVVTAMSEAMSGRLMPQEGDE